MAQPVPYVIQTDFSNEEAAGVAGRSTLRTAALDVEFSDLSTTIGQILTNLAIIQRDDGKLRDLTVETHTLSGAVLALIGSGAFTIKGAWLTATAYVIGNMVIQGTGTYVCFVAHTSGVFATDLAAGKWGRIFDSTSFIASGISFTPTGTIAATDVQSAIAEAALEACQKANNLSDVTAAAARGNLSVFSKAEVQASSSIVANNTGGVDTLSAAFTPAITVWADDQLLICECSGANATTTPTWDPGVGTPKTIVRPDGSALLVGDIPGANFRAMFVYDLSLDKVLLLNPNHVGATPGAAGQVLTSAGASVQPSFQSVVVTAVTTNRAINGCFRLDQLLEGTAVNINAAGPIQGLDQWSGFGVGASGVFTMQREADPDYTGEFNLLLSCTTADAAIAAGDLYGIHTDLEGYQVAEWLIGTAAAKQITVQFEVKANIVGTFGISLTNSAVNRTYVGIFTINNVNTVEAKSVTLNLDTAGTWLQTNGTGLRLRIALAGGSTYQGAAGAWTGSNFYTTSAQSNFMSVNTNVMRLKRFQVVQAASAIAFERRPLQVELALARRYYAKTYSLGTAPGAVTSAGSIAAIAASVAAGTGIANWLFPVEMRAAPAIAYYNPATGATTTWRRGTGTDVSVSNPLTQGTPCSVVQNTGAINAAELFYGHITANARLA